jgi:hypothetical protein
LAVGGAALGGAAAGGGICGALVGGLGAKTAAGVATAALLTAGAVEVKKQYGGEQPNQQARHAPAAVAHASSSGGLHTPRPHHAKPEVVAAESPESPSQEPPPVADQYAPTVPAPTHEPTHEAPVTEPEPTAAPTDPAADGSTTDTEPVPGTEEEGSGAIEIVPEESPPAPEPPAPVPPQGSETLLLPAQ